MLVLWHNKYLNLFYVCSAFHRRHELFINDDEICSECFFLDPTTSDGGFSGVFSFPSP